MDVGTWQTPGAPALGAPEDRAGAAGWTVAGNAQAAYGERLALARTMCMPCFRCHRPAAPGARADLGWPGRTGGRRPAAHIRDKVARTTVSVLPPHRHW